MDKRLGDLAAAFAALHHAGHPLVLPNAWDAGSARAIEAAGAAAIATTSAGVAWAHGYPDGEQLPLETLIGAVREIARGLKIPLSVDVETGYSQDAREVGRAVSALIDAGAVGINIEDGEGKPRLLSAKIAAARAASDAAGIPLFVNARTDVYLRALVPADEAVAETVVRARGYREAGADGIFVPLLTDREAIRQIASEIELPLNVMIVPGLPPVAELATLGVRRVSSGAAIAGVAFTLAHAIVSDLIRHGTYSSLVQPDSILPGLNDLFGG